MSLYRNLIKPIGHGSLRDLLGLANLDRRDGENESVMEL